MRIISGKYKGRHIAVPNTFKARPTTDFAKENLFNILTNLIDFEQCANALDLFAGTGSISLEMLSRGCARVVSIEKDYKHFAFLKKIKEELKLQEWQPQCNDTFRYIDRCKQQFNFIFADPPYALKELSQIPRLIFENNLLTPDGLFVLEHGKDYDFSKEPHFMQHRIYGSVNLSFFT